MYTKSFVSALLLIFASTAQAGITPTESIDEKSWVDNVFDSVLSSYSHVRHCLEFTAEELDLPIELMMSVLIAENGIIAPINPNNDGTNDYGYFQINDKRLEELAELSITKDDLINDGCRNTFAAGFILKRHIIRSGDFWEGVGNYHYGIWGRYPSRHFVYRDKVYKAWQRILNAAG